MKYRQLCYWIFTRKAPKVLLISIPLLIIYIRWLEQGLTLVPRDPISYGENMKNTTEGTNLILDLDEILLSSHIRWPVVVMNAGGNTGNCFNTYAISLALRKEFGVNATFAVSRKVFLKVNEVIDTEGLNQYIADAKFTHKADKEKMLKLPPEMFKSKKNLVAHLKPSISYEITTFENTQNKTVLLLQEAHNRMYMIADHIQEIRRSFRVKSKLIEKAQMFLHKMSEGRDLVYVGFHIRRTDYLFHSKNYNGVSVPGPQYYVDALEHYRQRFANVLFVVASDDVSHAKSHLEHHSDVVFTEMQSPSEDMALLASCNHSIMTVGSFGWWSSFLAGGDVIYALLFNFTNPPFAHPEMMGSHGFENFHGIPA